MLVRTVTFLEEYIYIYIYIYIFCNTQTWALAFCFASTAGSFLTTVMPTNETEPTRSITSDDTTTLAYTAPIQNASLDNAIFDTIFSESTTLSSIIDYTTARPITANENGSDNKTNATFVSVSTRASSKTTKNSKAGHTTYKNNPIENKCPTGYYFQYGNVDHTARMITVEDHNGNKIGSIDECGKLCDNTTKCRAIQWSSSGKKCILSRVSNAVGAKINDYWFCSKVERHTQCCKANDVPVYCEPFCIPNTYGRSLERQDWSDILQKCRAYIDIIRKCTNNDCPTKYIKKHGSLTSLGNEKVGISMTKNQCVEKCTKSSTCQSFDYSNIKGKCNLNSDWEPTYGPSGDYVFCAKEREKHVQCCSNKGVPVECIEFCVPHPGHKTYSGLDTFSYRPELKEKIKNCRRYYLTVLQCT